jgi:4'-phosphopantetheinyl transferase
MVAFPSVDALTSMRASRVRLEGRTIDVWSCSLEASATALAACRHWLSEEERIRAARFVRSEDQTHFALAHGVLRFVLARYIGGDPAALRFQHGQTGKPCLTGREGSLPDVRFNLSHSHGRMLIAVAHERDVGVDLEQVREAVEPLKLAERFYTAAEYDRITQRPVPDHPLEFYRLWVAKEAVLKGQGIGIPSLQECEIITLTDSPRAGMRPAPGSAVQPGWTIQWLRCGWAWQGAVSALGNGWSVQVLDEKAHR